MWLPLTSTLFHVSVPALPKACRSNQWRWGRRCRLRPRRGGSASLPARPIAVGGLEFEWGRRLILLNTVPFCCSQLGTASAAKSSRPHRPPYHLPPQLTFGSRSEARRARAARRGGAEAGALHPARGRHRLAPQLTALRPLRRRTTGVAQKATPGVGCSLDPSPAAPSPGRLTAHGALGCSPPPPRVPRRHACPLP